MAVFPDLKSQANLNKLIKLLNSKVCFLCYVVGLVWFLALAHHHVSSPTYFSENALLPGLVDSEFYHDFGAEGYHNELLEIIKEKHMKEDMYEMPTEWLLKQFRLLGLDACVQNYTFKYPFGVYYDRFLAGQNVYAIFRAPRTSGTEALVLSVPFSPEMEGPEVTYPGIALMLALAKSFKRNSYWAKDIIFLVTDNKEIGIQAWLSSYHHVPNQFIKAGVLQARSGSIQAAINLELTSKIINQVNIKFEGINGRLPNLDLINTVERLFYKEGLKVVIQKKPREYSSKEWHRYLHSLKLMMTMVWNQATGSSTGNHGFFHKFNIDAVTIQGFKTKSKKHLDFVDFGRALEGIFRSLNNLLERFHQSFFFYLLPSPDRYISIGVYMPPLGIMILPIAIKIIALWLTIIQPSTSTTPTTNEADKNVVDEKSTSTVEEGASQESKENVGEKSNIALGPSDDDDDDDEKKESLDEFKEVNKIYKSVDTSQDTTPQIENNIDKLTHAFYIITATTIGIFTYRFDDYFVRSSLKFGLSPEEGLAIGYLIIHLLVIAHPFIINWYCKGDNELKINRNFMNCITLIIFGILVGMITVVNVSMGFFVATLWVPLIIINQPTKYMILKATKCFLVVLLSPLGIITIGVLINSLVLNRSQDIELLSMVKKTWYDVQDSLMSSAIQYYLFDVWTYPLLSLGFIPLWSLFWLLAIN